MSPKVARSVHTYSLQWTVLKFRLAHSPDLSECSRAKHDIWAERMETNRSKWKYARSSTSVPLSYLSACSLCVPLKFVSDTSWVRKTVADKTIFKSNSCSHFNSLTKNKFSIFYCLPVRIGIKSSTQKWQFAQLSTSALFLELPDERVLHSHYTYIVLLFTLASNYTFSGWRQTPAVLILSTSSYFHCFCVCIACVSVPFRTKPSCEFLMSTYFHSILYCGRSVTPKKYSINWNPRWAFTQKNTLKIN